jgi:hypothetical protein
METFVSAVSEALPPAAAGPDEDELLHAARTSGAMAAPRARTPALRSRERRLSEAGVTGLTAGICELR